MKDNVAKKVGAVHSTSRNWEKAMKKRTHKARRQEGKKAVDAR